MITEFQHIASLVGDPTRAAILWTLLDGKAFTSSELAAMVDTSPQNISMHLAKLVQGRLLSVESQGRHKYFKYASKEIAYGIESLATLAGPLRSRSEALNPKSPIRYCRTCYDHLAGHIGVAITQSLVKQRIIEENKDEFKLSHKGEKWFHQLGIPVEELKDQRRSFLRPCLDWSERKPHMAGALAAALLNHMLSSDWIRRTKNSRVVVITGKGRKEMYDLLKIQVEA